jgi:hypothetical protein
MRIRVVANLVAGRRHLPSGRGQPFGVHAALEERGSSLVAVQKTQESAGRFGGSVIESQGDGAPRL